MKRSKLILDGEGPIFISLIISLGLIVLTVIGASIWPGFSQLLEFTPE